MTSLDLLGGASLTEDGASIGGPASQRHRLALLALLAVAPSRALSRERLMALLWPERDVESARKLLNQSVYVLRKALGQRVLLSRGEELRLDPGRIDCDVIAFEEALERGERERAVALYAGPFLDGFYLDRARAFERWVERERARLEDAHRGALERLAESAEQRGELKRAVEWWKARAADEPYNSRVALRLIEALEASGNPAGALRHAGEHERALREELGIEPPPEIATFADRLRSEGPRRPVRTASERPAVGPGPPPSEPDVGPTEPEPRSDEPRSRPDPAAGTPWRPAVAWTAAALLVGIAIVGTLRLDPGGPDLSSARHDPARRTENLQAYELYRRGSDPTLLRSEAGARRGFEHLRRAVALDSTYVAAWAELACLALRLTTEETTDRSRAELHALAADAARRAVALDDSAAEAHAALGLVRMTSFELRPAERHLARAIELDPDHTRAREWLAAVHLLAGRPARALAVAREARERDPLSPSARAEVARALAASGRCDQAMPRLRELDELEPRLLRVGLIRATCHARRGEWREGARVVGGSTEDGGNALARALHGHMLARAGEPAEAARLRDALRERRERGRGAALPLAILHAGLADRDAAFAWLDRALEDRTLFGSSLHYQVLEILEASLGDDPRFGALERRLRPGASLAARTAG